ncbi:hypothetical protein Tco_0389782 [Tanacetum coccineum]
MVVTMFVMARGWRWPQGLLMAVAVEWWSQRGVEVVGGAWCDDDESGGDGGDDVGCGVVIEVMMVWWQRGGVGWQRRRLAENEEEIRWWLGFCKKWRKP